MEISGNNQWQSVAIRGNPWQSVAIRGNPWQSVAIRGPQRNHLLEHEPGRDLDETRSTPERI